MNSSNIQLPQDIVSCLNDYQYKKVQIAMLLVDLYINVENERHNAETEEEKLSEVARLKAIHDKVYQLLNGVPIYYRTRIFNIVVSQMAHTSWSIISEWYYRAMHEETVSHQLAQKYGMTVTDLYEDWLHDADNEVEEFVSNQME